MQITTDTISFSPATIARARAIHRQCFLVSSTHKMQLVYAISTLDFLNKITPELQRFNPSIEIYNKTAVDAYRLLIFSGITSDEIAANYLEAVEPLLIGWQQQAEQLEARQKAEMQELIKSFEQPSILTFSEFE